MSFEAYNGFACPALPLPASVGAAPAVSDDIPAWLSNAWCPQLRGDLLLPDNHSVAVVVRAFSSSGMYPAFDFLSAESQRLARLLLPMDVRVESTGQKVLWRSMRHTLEQDLLVGDGISIPTALLVLCWALRSFRFVVIPLVSVAVSTFVGLMFLVPIAKASVMPTVAPNMMMSLIIAMSVDYSLFMLSRFREEVLQGMLAVASACARAALLWCGV